MWDNNGERALEESYSPVQIISDCANGEDEGEWERS